MVKVNLTEEILRVYRHQCWKYVRTLKINLIVFKDLRTFTKHVWFLSLLFFLSIFQNLYFAETFLDAMFFCFNQTFVFINCP